MSKRKILIDYKTHKIDPFLPMMTRKGDLSSIKHYGYLRIAYIGTKVSNAESRLLKEFSQSNDLKIIYLSTTSQDSGQQLLIKDLVDIFLGGFQGNGVFVVTPFNIQKEKNIRWSIRSENIDLINALNQKSFHSTEPKSLLSSDMERLPDLKQRKILRVVTQPDPHNYFLKKGKPAGFEYELLQRFAREQKLWLEVVITEDEEQMLMWLEEDKVDLATIVSSDLKYRQVASTLPYYPARNFIITRSGQDELRSLNDIDGRELALYSGKYQHQGIEFLMDKGFSISTVEPESDESMSKFLQRIVDGEYDIAMVSAKKYLYEGKFHDDLKVIATVNDQPLHRWVVNEKNKELNISTNSFLRKEFKGKFYNIVYKRYFPEKSKIHNGNFYISPYDEMVIKYASKYQFDWRLVLAQMYQESKFKPDARSVAGARGLMQILPRTAREIGLTHVEDPEIGIRAGLKYMKTLRDRYGDDISINDKNWFALASYNAGYERIQDARMFAEKLGFDPDRWFGNVELAMQKLAKPENRQHTRFGNCHCGQTVVYVRNIKNLYNSYVQLSDPRVVASNREKLLTGNVSDLLRSPF